MLEVQIQHRYRDAALDIAFRSAARTIALFGDSGVGKTSVLQAISGLLTPQAGRISLDGEAWLDRELGINLPAAQRAIGYVFQDGRLFPHMDVRANLLYGPRARGRDSSGLDSVVERLGLSSLLTRRPAQLSGGERQRVAIGRALLASPQMLLLDEPMTGLHREARADVLDHLRQLQGIDGLIIVLVSHQGDEVLALADEVVLIDDGSVTAQWDRQRFAIERGLGRGDDADLAALRLAVPERACCNLRSTVRKRIE